MHMSISSDFKLGLTKHQCRKLMESVHVRIKFKWHLDDFWFQIWNLRGLKYFQMTLTADPGLCSSNLTMDLAFSMSILAPWFCFKYLGTVYPWRRPTTPVFEGGWYTWYIHSYIPGSNAICTYSKWLTWHGWIPMSKVAQNLLVFLGIRKFWIATGRSGRYGFESNSRACGNFGDLHKVAKSLLHFPGIWSYHVIPFDDVHQKRVLYLQHHPEALRDSEIPYSLSLGDCIPCGSGGFRKLEDGFRDFGVAAGSGGSAVDGALVVVDRREDGVLTEFVETPGLQPPVGKPGNGARNLRLTVEGLEVNFEVGLQDENGENDYCH